MKLFIQYIRSRVGIIATLALFALIFYIVLLMYRLQAEAMLYASALCLAAGIVIAVVDYRRFLGRHRMLTRLLSSIDLSPEPLPSPRDAIDADYQRLLRAACDSAAARAAILARQRTDMEEYYVLWTHQIKTPIAAMRLILQGSDSDLSRSLRPELFKIEQYAEMALNYTRLDGDGSDFVIREHSLDRIVKQSVRKYAPMFIHKRLSLKLFPIDCSVLTDEKWLCFAIEQVLSNAVKYTPSGEVRIYMEDDFTLVIEDTGIGIVPEDLPRVFERRFTGLNGRADKRATGIGLYLAWRALNRLGHTIAIDSQPGSGTTVRIDLSVKRLDTRD